MDDKSKRYPYVSAIELDRAGDYYSRHVAAMTEEGLHSKTDIAGQLGWRDMTIDTLKAETIKLREEIDRLREPWETREDPPTVAEVKSGCTRWFYARPDPSIGRPVRMDVRRRHGRWIMVTLFVNGDIVMAKADFPFFVERVSSLTPGWWRLTTPDGDKVRLPRNEQQAPLTAPLPAPVAPPSLAAIPPVTYYTYSRPLQSSAHRFYPLGNDLALHRSDKGVWSVAAWSAGSAMVPDVEPDTVLPVAAQQWFAANPAMDLEIEFTNADGASRRAWVRPQGATVKHGKLLLFGWFHERQDGQFFPPEKITVLNCRPRIAVPFLDDLPF